MPPFVKGIGVSTSKKLFHNNPNEVQHVIAGLTTVEDIQNLLRKNRKVLILGFKQYGRGKDYYNPSVEANINILKSCLKSLLAIKKGILSFDNLAIEQLDVKNNVTEKEWDDHYMGDDGQFTMYVDGVTQEYAKSSISPRAKTMGILRDFKEIK